jgi:hypothetical protein
VKKEIPAVRKHPALPRLPLLKGGFHTEMTIELKQKIRRQSRKDQCAEFFTQ